MLADALGRPLRFIITAGQVGDIMRIPGISRTGFRSKSGQHFWTQALPDWIGSHVRMFAFFGGVPRLIVPDNLKSGVSRASAP